MSVTPPLGYGIYSRSYMPAGGTHECVNVFGFVNGTLATGPTARAALDAIFVASGRPYDPAVLSDNWVATGSYCLVHLSAGLSSSAVVSSTPGTLAIDTPGPGTSLVVKKNTADAGRQFRGRVAYPAGFIDETLIDSAGNVDPALVSATTTKFESLRAAMAAASYSMVLIHGPFGTPPAPGPNPTGIASLSCTDLVGSQRRRLRGR